MRIFDNPNHHAYGPVRRLWVVLVALDMLDAAERAYPLKSQPWDIAMAMNLQNHDEARAARLVVRFIFRYGYKEEGEPS